MSLPSPRAERVLLLVLAFAAAGLFIATPGLIRPWRADVPWHESGAFFPRLGLLIVAVGAVAEIGVRLRTQTRVASDELDSSAASLPRALGSVVLFALYALAVPVLGFAVSTALFLVACGRLVGLGWRRSASLALPLAVVLWLVFVRALKVAFGHGLLF